MKQGADDLSAGGFTLVETLIVLAVTSLMFVAAVTFVSGRQARTQFQTGINDLQQQFTQIISDNQSGYYPSADQITCKRDGAGNKSPIITNNSADQGTNGACIFVGSVFRFGFSTGGPTSGGQNFTVYPLAANRLSGADPVETWRQARPVAIAPGATTNSTLKGLNLSQTYTPQFGINLVSWQAQPLTGSPYTANPNTTAIMTGLMTDLTASQDSDGLASGSVGLSLYGYSHTSFTTSKGFVDSFAAATSSTEPFKLSSISLCYASDTTDQSGLINIGGQAGLQVSLKVFTNRTCTP